MTVSCASVTAEPRLADTVLNRRLVVISYHYPPDGSIGGMRWAGLTKYLARLGWSSWVITGAPMGGPIVPGVSVQSCPRRRTLNDWYQTFRRVAAREGSSRTPAPGPALRGAARAQLVEPDRLPARLRLEAGLLLSLPDQARGWILRAARQARRVISQVQPHVVVSSGPPHSAHLAAWLATRGRATRWFVDFRDPWAGPITDAWRGDALYRSWLGLRFITGLERLVVTAASGVVCNTREFARAMRARYPGANVELVPNAVDREQLPIALAAPFPGLGMAHVGTIYGGRDLGPVLRALRVFLDRHPSAAAAGPLLRMAGHIEEPCAGDLRHELSTLRLDRHVEFLGVLPRAAALGLLARSRIGLVLAQGQELQVPAKLYEILGLGMCALVIAPSASAASSEGRMLGARTADPRDVAAIVRVLEDVWLGRVATPGLRPSADYRHLARHVANLLGTNPAGCGRETDLGGGT